ncbi:protein kinase domain-containing protein [Nocardia sp. CA-290969]|uniref:serine/threonine-protein kinase n=1 Tax=Nocardia sp. CA-290969 TaxID=3239986 RepID=UPI003D9144BB
MTEGAAVLGVGAAFAGYRIEGVLGRGGMGTVYLARHPRLPRSVALKLLDHEVSTDTELVRRFEREADVIARLEHPGIIGVLDRGADDGHLWIAMQYVRGSDAASLDPRAYPAATVVRLVGETASALDYAHSQGVLHRDVKPANILIAASDAFRESHAILTDFGIARLTDPASTKVTATGTFTATLSYGSPEQLSGQAVDHRSDQYSLACTLFAILTGQPPYTATNPGQVIMGHLSQPVPRLTATRPDLPPAMDAVLDRAMAKQRDDRFASCSEFTAAALGALEGLHIAGSARSATTAVHSAPHEQPVSAAPIPEHRQVSPVWTPERQPAPPVWTPPGPVATPHPYPRPYAGGARRPAERFETRPSRTTALTAVIVTLICALFGTAGFLIALAAALRAVAAGSPHVAAYAVVLLIGGVLVLLWNSAWLLLLAARHLGRMLTIGCSGLGTIIGVLGMAASPYVVIPERFLAAAQGTAAIVLCASAAGLVCAAHRSTARWIAYRTAHRNTPRGW